MLLPEKVVTFEFPGCDGFEVDLAFLSKESNQALFKKCQKTKFDRKTRQAVEEFDDELFLDLYVGSILKGWKGLKMKYLTEIVLLEVPPGAENKTLDYTHENAVDLMKSSSVFDQWVSEIISDLGNFMSNNTTKSLQESSSTSKSPAQV